MPTTPSRPTKAALLAAVNRRVPDVIAPDLKVLLCGINPGLYSAATGHHFARPGNRFWPALHLGGFTRRQLAPWEEQQLLTSGYGITNIVNRATANASELTPEELVAGGRQLVRKIKRYRPRCLAILGVGAYRHAFNRPDSQLGRQQETIGETTLWILPNPSGLNAHYQLAEIARLFRQLRRAMN